MAPTHSPKTAPITEITAAIFAPLKRKGSEEGTSTAHRIRERLASSVRIIRPYSGSTARRPSSVLTVIGKKQTSAITTSFGPIPNPSQTTRIGAIAITGIVCDAIRRG